MIDHTSPSQGGAGGASISSGGAGGAGVESTSCEHDGGVITLERALYLARCQPNLPASAELQFARSNSSGTMDAEGRDQNWSLWFWNEATQQRFGVSIWSLGVKVGISEVALRCEGWPPPVTSSAVVTDAVARFAAIDPHPDAHRNYWIDHSFDCPGEEEPPALSIGSFVRIAMLEPEALPEQYLTRWWFYHYSGNTFARVCGPCAATSESDCTACSP